MVEAERLGHWFVPERWVLRRIDLRLEPGEVLAILGPNGCGKSTLLRCLAGLLAPREGRVRRRVDAVGYVPQAQQLAFDFTVLEAVLMGRARFLRLGAVPGSADRHAARAALERVGLAHLAERPFSALSGGERQLALIARALAVESPLLVLDEPASALDLRHQGRVLLLLRQLARQGYAVAFTTHHPQHALLAADRALLLFGPGQYALGPVARVVNEDSLTRLYGVPVRLVEADGAPGAGGWGVVPLYDAAGVGA